MAPKTHPRSGGPPSSVDFARLVEASPDIVFQITPDACWSYLSPAWTALLGHSVAVSLGRPVTALVDPADVADLEEALGQVLRHGVEAVDRRLRWRAADGGSRWMEFHCRRLTDGDGHLIGGVGRLNDVTDVTRDAETFLRESTLTNAILETAKAPIIVMSAEGRVVRFNRACEYLSGRRATEVMGRDGIDLLVPEEDRPGVEEAMRRTLTDGASRHENRWLHRDGSTRLLLWSLTLVELGGVRHIVAVGTNITRQRAIEHALRDSERRQREIADLLTEGVYVVDARGRVTFLNPAAGEALGWTAEEAAGLSSHEIWHNAHPDGRPYPVEDCPVRLCLTDGAVVRRHEDWFRTRSGGWLPVALSAAPIIRDGTVTGAVVAFHDISDRLAAQDRLRESETRYRTLFDGSGDSIFVITLDDDNRAGPILQVNPAAADRLGYTRDDLRGMTIHSITAPESIDGWADTLAELRDTGEATFERVHIGRDGIRVPVEIRATLADYDGQRVIIAVARDITERKEAERRIRYLADYDQLTGLPNRAYFNRRCEEELSRAARHGHRTALLFLDLDGFKAVNDTHGHAIGDDLLKVVAGRLTTALRRSDLAARQGGDEFVILLPEVEGAETAETVSDKLIAEVNAPVHVEGLSLRVGVSIGIAMAPEDGETASDLQRHADAAMYVAKADGRNRWARFHPDMEPATS